ncbi:hypothetical protein LCGC14_1464110, partial [marine sediment metagenome]
MSGIWRKYPEKDAKDHDLYQQDQYDIIKQKQTELKDKVHTVMEDQYLLEKSIKELKDLFSRTSANMFINREVLGEFFEEMSFHYEVDGSRTNAAWMFFYDTLLEKLDGENSVERDVDGDRLLSVKPTDTDSKLSSYHITEKGKRALELIDSLGGEN